MKRNAGTALTSALKWVVVPIGLAALGFYVVGPRVADKYLAASASSGISKVEDESGGVDTKSSGAPKIEVTSEKLKSQPRSRRRSKPKTENPENTIRINEPDEISPEPPSNPGDDDGEGPGAIPVGGDGSGGAGDGAGDGEL